MEKTKGFKTVETNLEEINEKVRKHRKKVFLRIGFVVLALAILGIAIELWMEIRSYSSYEIRNSLERSSSQAAKYQGFQGNILEYSNDGISYMDSRGERIWNQSYEMTNPTTVVCEKYVSVFDKGGTHLYVMSDAKILKEIETSKPIETVSIADQGTVAVLMKEDTNSYVKLFDKSGKELASGEFYSEQGSYPIDIALSYDAKKLAVALVDISSGKTKSTISFYNFGSVGQNEIDNNVGTFTYDDVLIPRVAYVSEERLVAFGDKEIFIFEGKEKPQLKKEISIPENVQSVFYNESYLGMTTESEEEQQAYHIIAYNMKGTVVMENDTSIHYEEIEFLGNNDICVRNEKNCEIFTVHGIKKFSGEFDASIDAMISLDRHQNYVFVFDDTIEEVRLK